MWQYLRRFRQEFFPSRDEFDSTHGTDTGGLTSLHLLHIRSANKSDGTRYQAADPAIFQRLMQSIPVEGYTFVDLGCGKGRVLWMARERGYRNIIGVEFSHLAKVARRNVRGMGIAVFTEDAAGFDFPKVPLVIFLFNPFKGAVVKKVIGRLAFVLTLCLSRI